MHYFGAGVQCYWCWCWCWCAVLLVLVCSAIGADVVLLVLVWCYWCWCGAIGVHSLVLHSTVLASRSVMDFGVAIFING